MSSGAEGQPHSKCGRLVLRVLLVFIAPKPKTVKCPILDLKALKVFIQSQKFFMESTNSAIAFPYQGDYHEYLIACPHFSNTSVIFLLCFGFPALLVCGPTIQTIFYNWSVHQGADPCASFAGLPGHPHCGVSG